MKRIISFFILLAFIVMQLSGCKSFEKVDNLSKAMGVSKDLKNQSMKIHILLYFPDNKHKYLIPEERLVSIDESIEKTILEEVLKGSLHNKLNPWLSKNTRIIGLTGKDNILTVNCSKEFINSFTINWASNVYIIYSIVNSLTELPGVKKIVFKLEGRSIRTIGGIDFSKPFERNRGLFNRDSKLRPNEVLQKEMSFEKLGRWFEAYLLMSDDSNDKSRKYYDAYLREMDEMKDNGFLNTDFYVGDYKLDTTGKKASVEVYFNSKSPGVNLNKDNLVHFNVVKIEDIWMVDWLTGQ